MDCLRTRLEAFEATGAISSKDAEVLHAHLLQEESHIRDEVEAAKRILARLVVLQQETAELVVRAHQLVRRSQ